MKKSTTKKEYPAPRLRIDLEARPFRERFPFKATASRDGTHLAEQSFATAEEATRWSEKFLKRGLRVSIKRSES